MKGGSRVGGLGRSKGFGTGRVERAVGDPIIIRGGTLGVGSQTGGVGSRHSVASIERYCWRWGSRTLGRDGGDR